MFELRNSGENRGKLSKKIFENLRRAYKDLIYVKKNSKISHACVPLKLSVSVLTFPKQKNNEKMYCIQGGHETIFPFQKSLVG